MIGAPVPDLEPLDGERLPRSATVTIQGCDAKWAEVRETVLNSSPWTAASSEVCLEGVQ